MHHYNCALTKKAIAQTFGSAANTYDSVAILQREIGHRLLEHLDDIQEKYWQDLKFNDTTPQIDLFHELPTAILDLGGGTGYFTDLLKKRFQDAMAFNLDLSFNMLTAGNQGFSECIPLCGDAEALPFASNSFDLIFSNCMLQWSFDLPKLFKELHRCLKPKGILLVATFGSDTLFELRESFKSVDNAVHVNAFPDIYQLGDIFVSGRLCYPVFDREIITLTYPSFKELISDLKSMGATHVNREPKSIGLMTRHKHSALLKAYHQFIKMDGLLPATFDVIYGCALGKYTLDK